VKDKLYGTALLGGKYDMGTVFSINPVGNVNFTVIHAFAGAPNDGGRPRAALIDANGKLYGTTELGGEHNGGTLFKLTV